MARIQAIDPRQAEGKTKALLDGVQKKLGITPNLIRTLAVGPAALEGYLGFSQALAGGRLSARLREQIALAVAGANACEYCASAHSAIGKSIGIDATELAVNLQAKSPDPKTAAALEFARHVVAKRGWVSDEALQQVREAGYDEAEIVEIIANVALNLFTNYFNHIAATEVDFPVVQVDPALAA